MMNNSDTALVKMLLEKNVITEEKISGILENARAEKISLQSYLVAKGLMNEDELLPLAAEASGLEYVNLRETGPQDDAIRAVPPKFAWHYNFVPVKIDGESIFIAMNEPPEVNVQDELRLMLGMNVNIMLARQAQITEFLQSHYGLGADTVDEMVAGDDGVFFAEGKDPSEKVPIEDVHKLAGDASVIRLVKQIILEAYRKRATDIHIEPFRGKLRLRYRIDGVLQEQKVPEEVDRFLPPILSRIKILSDLNIVERRIPQDGRAIVKVQEEVLDLRVSFIPTPHGESVVVRVLPSKMFFGLDRLGLSPEDINNLRNLLKKPSGIIFATGPTGSGKSTTLYAGLAEIDRTRQKVITIEDPIEYEMANITQIQVNESLGLTFAKGLRSMLRHDPDIMMVGEVRDRETAEIAIRVALTGHLVLSTLHTNDAATGITRLIDIGIEPYLVASSVEAFLAQRLVRVICPECREPSGDPAPEVRECILRNLGPARAGEISIFKGQGCEHCSFTGYYGRTAIYEILTVDNEIKTMIMEKATAPEIRRRAVGKGMRTLMQDGWEKVISGITSPEEVMKVCQDLEIIPPKPAAVKRSQSPSRTYADRPVHSFVRGEPVPGTCTQDLDEPLSWEEMNKAENKRREEMRREDVRLEEEIAAEDRKIKEDRAREDYRKEQERAREDEEHREVVMSLEKSDCSQEEIEKKLKELELTAERRQEDRKIEDKRINEDRETADRCRKEKRELERKHRDELRKIEEERFNNDLMKERERHERRAKILNDPELSGKEKEIKERLQEVVNDRIREDLQLRKVRLVEDFETEQRHIDESYLLREKHLNEHKDIRMDRLKEDRALEDDRICRDRSVENENLAEGFDKKINAAVSDDEKKLIADEREKRLEMIAEDRKIEDNRLQEDRNRQDEREGLVAEILLKRVREDRDIRKNRLKGSLEREKIRSEEDEKEWRDTSVFKSDTDIKARRTEISSKRCKEDMLLREKWREEDREKEKNRREEDVERASREQEEDIAKKNMRAEEDRKLEYERHEKIKGYTAGREEDPQRVYIRAPARVKMSVRLVEKGEGDIIELERTETGTFSMSEEEKIFTEDLPVRVVQEEELLTASASGEIGVETCDISAGGAIFSSAYLFPPGSILDISMTIPGIDESIRCLSKVVRIEKDLPRCFRIAVCYLDMSGEDRIKMDNFVREERSREREIPGEK